MEWNEKWGDGWGGCDKGWLKVENDEIKNPDSAGMDVMDLLKVTFWVAIMIGAIWLLVGCKSGQVQVVERVRVDSVVVEKVDSFKEVKVFVDSVYVRDSMWMEIKGDTIWMWKEKVRESWKEKTDTIIKWLETDRSEVKVDSVPVVVEVEKVKVEKKTGWWGWVMSVLGGLAVGVCVWWERSRIMKWVWKIIWKIGI